MGALPEPAVEAVRMDQRTGLNSSVSPSFSQDLLVPCSSLLGIDLSREASSSLLRGLFQAWLSRLQPKGRGQAWRPPDSHRRSWVDGVSLELCQPSWNKISGIHFSVLLVG